MFLLNLEKIKMSFSDKTLFQIDSLTIHSGEKIGLIGANGSGKSTLLQLIAGIETPDEGRIYRHDSFRYLKQFNEKDLPDKSGGEQNRQRIFDALKDEPLLLLLDEPDNHLDMNSIAFLKNRLDRYQGAVLMVSHNRDLLGSICDKYWDIDNERITVFTSSLQDLFAQKQLNRSSQEAAYEKYNKEKTRLKNAAAKTQNKSSKVKKAPSRMGNSEARLHKMGDQKAKANLDKAASRIKTRIAQLEKADRPKIVRDMKFDLDQSLRLHQPVLITARSISKKFPRKTVFENADFSLLNGSKAALIGSNGAGKTTLLDMIYERDSQMTFAKNLKIGYLGQFFNEIDFTHSIIGNINSVSLYNETFTRTILARLLFRTDSVYKKCSLLSGGELTRVSLAMLFLGSYNLLLLDEPTNHLDLPSIKAVEETLSDYAGTVIFASHDKTFINNVATEKWLIENKTVSLIQ